MLKPKNLLVYYGWMNSFNSASNGWSNELVAQDMAKYDLIVLGSGIESTDHGDNANINTIIPRIRVLNPDAMIFGYVTANQAYASFKSKVDEWVTNRGADGVMFDEAGYDYGTVATNGREALNSKIDYCHSQDLLCFLNAWKVQHLFGVNSDPSYPDATWNPNRHDINLDENDWYMLESFAVDASGSYESKTTWASRGQEVVDVVFCNVAAISCLDESSNTQADFDFIYTSALMWELEAVGSGDYGSSVSYGASNAKTKFWNRSSVAGIEDSYNIAVVLDGSDSDVYHRFIKDGHFKVDFSAGSETSLIDNYEG